jgi:hypothetical protein
MRGEYGWAVGAAGSVGCGWKLWWSAGSWFVRAAVFRFVEETEGEENLLKLVG